MDIDPSRIQAWTRKGLEIEIQATEQKLVELRQAYQELGGDVPATDMPVDTGRSKRRPMSPETRAKLQESQRKRWEFRRGAKNGTVKG